MSYNPNILRETLKARALTERELSQRLGMDYRAFERELQRSPEPQQTILKKIARELSVPTFIFYMERLPPIYGALPDFRSAHPVVGSLSRETIKAILLAEGVQKAAALDDGRVEEVPHFTATDDSKIAEFALKARNYFNITLEDQLEAQNANAFYITCRKRIEDKGIFVLQESFPERDGSGFCLAHSTHPVIVVNTRKQTKGRRLFTLIHELAHILMRKSGISDPFIRNNETERACNKFAGSFLVPRIYINSLLRGAAPRVPDREDVRRAARWLKISQEATVLRLEQLRIFAPGSYERWKSVVGDANPDWFEKGGRPAGGKPPPQEKVKLAKYGFRFAQVFDRLLRKGSFSEINLYRATGLKPKYQRAYFAYANSLSGSDFSALDLADDE